MERELTSGLIPEVQAMFSKARIAALLLTAMLVFGTAAAAETLQAARYDREIQANVTRQLQHKSQFKDVRASVAEGVVTLQGTVNSYPQKLDAAKLARKQDHVRGVNDLLQVAGPTVPDDKLRQELAKKLAYSAYGYGHVFDVLTVGVENGIVAVGGEVHDPYDKSLALGAVEYTPGVKDVVDQIKVAPVSFFDDSLRVRTLRAIYDDPVLARYALDPQAPIRIVVDNGNVALYGVVDNNLDRQVAFMRASAVPGAFSVTDHLTVAHGSAS
jgi:hyperosmotically inducible protein